MTTESFVTNQQLFNSPAGNDCTFVKMGGAGLKVYEDRDDRDDQYELQRFFHEVGLAPKCWFAFDFVGPNGEDMFAYYSDVVTVTGDADCGSWVDFEDACDSLKEKLECEYGTYWSDNHSGNVGRDATGKFVMLDFGYMRATSSEDY
jgi:hypothetical protein